MILSKIIVTINTFDLLTFIQMRTDEYKLWQKRKTKTSENGCVQVRRDFDK